MDEAKQDLVRAWLVKAHHDLRAARTLAAAEDPVLDVAVYHCQQAGEKAVEAFLAFRDHPLERTHNIQTLVTRAEAYDPRFANWHDVAEQLTPFATAFRYPSDALDPDKEEYEEAERAAAEFVEFVCSLLPQEVDPRS